jgi:hypothetical protein
MTEDINREDSKSDEDIGKIEVENTQTPPQSEQPDMEIHKHPHHVTHKKKWSEYLLEFLMIFLAVFLGFIAENIRENYVEHHRAREYAQSLYNDLKKDTAELNRITSIKQWQNRNLDSLFILFNTTDPQKNPREFYYYSCFANLPLLPFVPSDITIQQLRNSGSLRYFTSVQLYNDINQYYNHCNFILEREKENRETIPPLALVAKIFSAKQLSLMYDEFGPLGDIRNAIHWPAGTQEFKLLDSYKESWNEYILYVQRQRRRYRLPTALFKVYVEKDQRELMADLRKEYDVD